MTIKYNNVYVESTYTECGMYEGSGPIKDYFDKIYEKDLYMGEKSWEKAEVKLLNDSISNLIKNNNLLEEDIDLLISGDLQNQITASTYMGRNYNIPFIGIYEACATIGEAFLIASNFIKAKDAKRVIIATSSHNMAAEKQFRNPTEYGFPKKKTATFTVTGGAACLLTNKKSKVKVESITAGTIVDMGVKDVNNMGAVMAPAAAKTLATHLKETGKKVEDFDLILTGDLGIYGKEIFREYLKKEYKINIKDNYDDCGTIIYNTNTQPVSAGASGPAASALTLFSYVYKEMLNGKYKKVLILPTGALFSPAYVYQKESIPAIANCISLEVI